jgi:hypothetical protein
MSELPNNESPVLKGIREKRDPITQAFLTQYYHRVHYEKKNLFGLIVGGVGEGKSNSAVVLSDNLYKFTPETLKTHLVYSPFEFAQALDNIKEVGEAVIWDEAGVGIPAREWQAVSNKAIGKTLQIFRATRSGRIYLFFVTPDISYIDVQARKMLNFFGICYRSGSTATMQPYEVWINRFKGDIHFKSPKYKIGRYTVKLRSFKVPKLRPELWEVYENKSIPRKEKLMKEYTEFLDTPLKQL